MVGDEAKRALLRRRFLLFVAISAVVWLGVMLVGGDSGALRLWGARRRLGEIEARALALERENKTLKSEIDRLGRDDHTTERIAREQLMMGRAGEEVILVPDRPADGDSTVPVARARQRVHTGAEDRPEGGTP